MRTIIVDAENMGAPPDKQRLRSHAVFTEADVHVKDRVLLMHKIAARISESIESIYQLDPKARITRVECL